LRTVSSAVPAATFFEYCRRTYAAISSSARTSSSSTYAPLAAEDRPESVAPELGRALPVVADLLTRVGIAILLDRVRVERDDDAGGSAD